MLTGQATTRNPQLSFAVVNSSGNWRKTMSPTGREQLAMPLIKAKEKKKEGKKFYII